MILSRQREFLVRMGEYESYKFGAFASFSHADFGVSESQLAAMSDEERGDLHNNIRNAVLDELDAQLVREIEDSAEITREKKSFILRAIGDQMDAEREATPAMPSPAMPVRRAVKKVRKIT